MKFNTLLHRRVSMIVIPRSLCDFSDHGPDLLGFFQTPYWAVLSKTYLRDNRAKTIGFASKDGNWTLNQKTKPLCLEAIFA